MADKIIYKIEVEIEAEKLEASLKSYGIPITEENIEDLLDLIQDDLDADFDLTIDNSASAMADNLGIEPPSD